MSEKQQSNVVRNCFYNANFNLGAPTGQGKFVWGVKTLDFDKSIMEQILSRHEYDLDLVFNFNLTALNEVGIVSGLIRADSKGAHAPIEEHPNFEAFIRALWRRIEPFKNRHGQRLPKEMPIEFRAAVSAAGMLLQKT